MQGNRGLAESGLTEQQHGPTGGQVHDATLGRVQNHISWRARPQARLLGPQDQPGCRPCFQMPGAVDQPQPALDTLDLAQLAFSKADQIAFDECAQSGALAIVNFVVVAFGAREEDLSQGAHFASR